MSTTASSSLRRAGFRRLDLALLVSIEGGWPVFGPGHLWRALAAASDLEHISLSTAQSPVNSFVHLTPL